MRILRVQKAFPLAATMLGLSVISSPAEMTTGTHSEQPLFQDLAQAQWKKMFPDLGDASPEIALFACRPKDRSDPTADPHAESPTCAATLAFGKRDPHNDQWQRHIRM